MLFTAPRDYRKRTSVDISTTQNPSQSGHAYSVYSASDGRGRTPSTITQAIPRAIFGFRNDGKMFIFNI